MYRFFHLIVLCHLVLGTGCQLFGLDQNEFEINLPEIPIGPVQMQSTLIRTDFCTPELMAALEASGEGLELPIVQGFPTDLMTDQQQVNLTQYRDKINGVTVRDITFKIDLNTFKKDLESIAIYFGPMGLVNQTDEGVLIDLDEAIQAGAAQFGSTGVIPGGTDTGGEFIPIRKNPSGALAVRNFLSSLQFSTLFATTLKLNPGDCSSLSGTLDVKANLAITFFIQPF